MNKEIIMNTYAIEQGYESWSEFISYQPIYRREEHYLKVTDLIQDELLKKVTHEITKNKINWIMSWKEIRKEILNTEIL